MEVKLFANLAEAAQVRAVSLEVSDEATVGDALDELFAHHPAIREEILTADGELQDHINILIDGSNISHATASLETTVDREAEIAIFPPVSGG